LQCHATLASGKPCSRPAEPDSSQCRLHAGVALRRRARGFYTTLLSEDERAALAEAAQLEGVKIAYLGFQDRTVRCPATTPVHWQQQTCRVRLDHRHWAAQI
jgi:hypothetical protein